MNTPARLQCRCGEKFIAAWILVWRAGLRYIHSATPCPNCGGEWSIVQTDDERVAPVIGPMTAHRMRG